MAIAPGFGASCPVGPVGPATTALAFASAEAANQELKVRSLTGPGAH